MTGATPTPTNVVDMEAWLALWAPPPLHAEADLANAPESYGRTRGLGCESCGHFTTKMGGALAGRGKCNKHVFDTRRGFVCADIALE